jgi:hypothetical protein
MNQENMKKTASKTPDPNFLLKNLLWYDFSSNFVLLRTNVTTKYTQNKYKIG